MVKDSAAAAQIHLTPTTICRGRDCPIEATCPPAETVTETTTELQGLVTTVTETTTEFQGLVSTYTQTTTVLQVQISTLIITEVSTTTGTTTETQITTAPCESEVECPTLTRTGTACRTCLVPQCTSRVGVTRPCGCDGPLPTSTVNLECTDPGVCNRIGCTTIYDVHTADC